MYECKYVCMWMCLGVNLPILLNPLIKQIKKFISCTNTLLIHQTVLLDFLNHQTRHMIPFKSRFHFQCICTSWKQQPYSLSIKNVGGMTLVFRDFRIYKYNFLNNPFFF